jgi:hypothetical protein
MNWLPRGTARILSAAGAVGLQRFPLIIGPGGVATWAALHFLSRDLRTVSRRWRCVQCNQGQFWAKYGILGRRGVAIGLSIECRGGDFGGHWRGGDRAAQAAHTHTFALSFGASDIDVRELAGRSRIGSRFVRPVFAFVVCFRIAIIIVIWRSSRKEHGSLFWLPRQRFFCCRNQEGAVTSISGLRKSPAYGAA